MTKSVAALLESFDRLPDEAKREAAARILRRSSKLDLPALVDEARIESAESVSSNSIKKNPSIAEPRRGEVWIADLGLAAKAALRAGRQPRVPVCTVSLPPERLLLRTLLAVLDRQGHWG